MAIPPVDAERVVRRVAGAAMRGIFDEVSTSVPRLALARIGFERPGREEQEIPAAHDEAMVQRPGNCGGGCLLRTGANVPSHARIASTSSWVILVMLG